MPRYFWVRRFYHGGPHFLQPEATKQESHLKGVEDDEEFSLT